MVQWTVLEPIARRTEPYSRLLDQERINPSIGHKAKCPGQVYVQLEREGQREVEQYVGGPRGRVM